MYIKFRPFPVESCMDNEFLSTKFRKLGSQRHLDLTTQTKSFSLYKNNYLVYLFLLILLFLGGFTHLHKHFMPVMND